MKTLLHNVILQAVRGIHEITLYPKFFVNVLFAERNPIDEFSRLYVDDVSVFNEICYINSVHWFVSAKTTCNAPRKSCLEAHR